MTVDVNNMPVINKVHTLLQEINVKSPSVLPKTKDGEIDTTGIQMLIIVVVIYKILQYICKVDKQLKEALLEVKLI